VNTDDLILVSIDDHVVEPPDMFVAMSRPNTSTRHRSSSPTTKASTNGCTRASRRASAD